MQSAQRFSFLPERILCELCGLCGCCSGARRMAMARIEGRSGLPFYRRLAWTVVVLLLLGAARAVAQFDRGALSGTIKDEQGAVMPGVTVTAHNTQTQQGVTTVTDGTGFYTFPNLLPGRYDIVAELQGF